MHMIWQRAQRLITARAHGQLDRIENPAEMLSQAVREQTMAVANGKIALRRLETWQRRLDNQIETERSKVAEMQGIARDAVSDGKDDIARWALQREREAEDRMRACREQKTRADELASAQRRRYDKLKSNLEALRNKHRLLLQRAGFARSLQAMVPPQPAGCEPLVAVVERMEEKVVRMEQEAEIYADVICDAEPSEDDVVRGYLREREIDDALARLKAKHETEAANEGEV